MADRITVIPKKIVTVIEPHKSTLVDREKYRQTRVAAYCRVSTDSEEQLTSYKTRKKVYTDMIAARKDSYNRRKVKEEDIPKYGRAVGTGTLIIGVSLIAAFVASFWNEKIMAFIVVPALVIGLGFILYAQFKYNKGIF